MARALALAERGWGRVHPNPLVGAVIVQGGRIVGEGWHAEFGGAHAEAMALGAAGDAARGATLYVTLEPCAHHGKQPPCVEAILAAGISRVVMALPDPNPEAAGGAGWLRAAGILVEEGMMQEAAARLNARFLNRFAQRDRPFVAVKLAVTMDGCIADSSGDSRWISGPEARVWVHHLRAGFGGVAVGASTAIADDVRLTVRGDVIPRMPPVRVVFDRAGRVSASHGIFADARNVPVWMVLNRAAASSGRQGLELTGATVIVADTLAEALRGLMERGLDALLVEGGGKLAGALLDAGLIDRIYQVQSPRWLGGGVPAWSGLAPRALTDALRWRTVDRIALGDDTMLMLER